jgi:2-oxoisovalerate dehydrogenase E1 component alpha subunit
VSAAAVEDTELPLSVRLFYQQLEVRAVEALLTRLNGNGRIGHFQPAADSAVAMLGATAACGPDDMIFGTMRDWPVTIGRGLGLDALLIQVLGKEGDRALGRAMPGAVRDKVLGLSLGDGSIAAHLVHAAGFGHAARLQQSNRMALATFGSAAQGNGELHAALNFAALHHAQVVFVARGPRGNELGFDQAAVAWGIPAVMVPGDDGVAVCEAVAEARSRALSGEGPTVVDARLDGEAAPKLAVHARDNGHWSLVEQQRVRQDIKNRLQQAQQAAESAPDVSPETLFREVFEDLPWFL